MSKIVDKFLLTGDKFMPELHLRQPEFTYIACGPFTERYLPRIKPFHIYCVIDVFTKYVWFKPLRDQKGKTLLNAFIKIVS